MTAPNARLNVLRSIHHVKPTDKEKEKLTPVFYCPKSGQTTTLLAVSPSFCFKEVTLISLPSLAVLRSNTLDLLKSALLKLSTVPALNKVKEEIYES